MDAIKSLKGWKLWCEQMLEDNTSFMTIEQLNKLRYSYIERINKNTKIVFGIVKQIEIDTQDLKAYGVRIDWINQ